MSAGEAAFIVLGILATCALVGLCRIASTIRREAAYHRARIERWERRTAITRARSWARVRAHQRQWCTYRDMQGFPCEREANHEGQHVVID